MSLRPERLADLPQRARRLHREGVVVAAGLEAAEDDVVRGASCGAVVRRVAQLLGEAA